MRVLITGIGGQDGSYLAENLLKRGYEVYGLVRPQEGMGVAREKRFWRLRDIWEHKSFHLVECPMTVESLLPIIKKIRPQYCYHLAAKSFVSLELQDEFQVMQENVSCTQALLETLFREIPCCRKSLAML